MAPEVDEERLDLIYQVQCWKERAERVEAEVGRLLGLIEEYKKYIH
jgi:hypothetical protein